jgi:hypothetical protein
LEEYVCATVRSRPNELADGFNKRLIDFWTGMIRKWPEQYKEVYAETTRFAPEGDRLSRQYMVEAGIAELLGVELTAAGIDHDPIDADDVYSKYEATPPEWFQIPH